MQNTTIGLKTAVCLTASVLLGASTSAAIIYDNTENYLGQMTSEPNGTELGDVVVFGGTDRLLTTIQFEYFLGATGGGAVSGNEMAQVFLRAMDGPVISGNTRAPGTTLWSSAQFSIESGFHTINIDSVNTAVPDSVAWTVVFSNLEGAETAGLLFYNPDTDNPGSNPTFLDTVTGAQEHYTIRHEANGSWSLLNHPGVVDNLNARFTAVPEPGTWAIILGGLATLGLVRRRKS